MGKWVECKLGSKIESNKQTVGKNYPHGDILYLDTGSITEGKVEEYQSFNIKDAPSRAKRLVTENDIIYSTVRPNQKHYGFVTNPQKNLVVSTGFSVISTKSEKSCPKFLYYLLTEQKMVDKLHNIADASTSAYPSLKPSDIEDLDINIPEDIEEQHAIAGVLSSLDDKIDLLNRENKTLEQMAQTLFAHHFTNNLDKQNWEEGGLGDILDTIESGTRPKGGINHDLKDGFASIGAESVNGLGNFSFEKTKFITKEFFDKMKRGKVQSYDVLVYKDGAYVGRKGMFAKEYPFKEFAVNEHVFILRTNDCATQSFLYFMLEEKKLHNLNANSAQPGLNQTAMKNFEIVIPPKDLILKFDELVKPLLKKVFENCKQVQTLEKLRDTLLPKLMSGVVRVEYENSKVNNVYSINDIKEKAAQSYLEEGKINIVKICSNLGIPVVINKSLNAKAEITYENKDFTIFINKKADNFSIAHELGHYFKHSDKLKEIGIAARKGEESYSTAEEQEADNFAAELLMPEECVIDYVEKALLIDNQEVNKVSFNKIKNKFNLSEIIIKRRLNALGFKIVRG